MMQHLADIALREAVNLRLHLASLNHESHE